jgi:hypothetical protein
MHMLVHLSSHACQASVAWLMALPVTSAIELKDAEFWASMRRTALASHRTLSEYPRLRSHPSQEPLTCTAHSKKSTTQPCTKFPENALDKARCLLVTKEI